ACFTTEKPFWPLTSIARELDTPKGSAHRIATTLEPSGVLLQDPITRQYHLGIRVLALSQPCISGLEGPDIALPPLERLAKAPGESASMATLDGLDIVYVARA